MIWAQLLAYVTGTVDQELLLRNEYLATENRILKGQIKGRLLLSPEEKAHWQRSLTGCLESRVPRAENKPVTAGTFINFRGPDGPNGQGRKALEEVAGAAQLDTILGWYRKLIARSLMDRDFASEWPDHGLLRKSSV